MLKRFCDLCGKPMDSESRTFKIKELKVSWYEYWFERIDAHDECVKKLFLLKEQDAVTVHDPGAFCPKCGWMLYSEDHPKFCGNCGQMLKWE